MPDDTSKEAPTSIVDDLWARFTPRERECMRLLARNFTTKEIALKVGLSPKTVEKHIAKGYGRLGVGDRREAIRTLLPFMGIIAPGEATPLAPAAAGAPFLQPPVGDEGDRAGADFFLEGVGAGATLTGRQSGAEGLGGRDAGAHQGGGMRSDGAAAANPYDRFSDPDQKSEPRNQKGRGDVPDPVRRLGWALFIAAMSALGLSVLIGAHDLLFVFHHWAGE